MYFVNSHGDDNIWPQRAANKKYIVNPFSEGIMLRRQTLTSFDVSYWRLKSIPALKELKYL